MSIETAKKVFEIESEAVRELIGRIGPEFIKAEEILARTEGRVIISGLGKSGIIARKIASTFSSIGVPAFYIHPVESAHGDIGMIMKKDSAVIISKSGATDDFISLINHLKRLGSPIIAMTGNPSSSLANLADVTLDVSVKCEACAFNIIPTASTTVALAMGDALAVSLIERKGFTAEDFALLHPGGVIGKKLTYRVKDIMVSGENLPLADIHSSMREVVDVISLKKLGIAVITENGRLSGVITDGDLRRLLQRVDRPLDIEAGEALIITAREGQPRNAPLTVGPDEFAAKAVNIMEKHIITSIVVAYNDLIPIGLIRWIDLSIAGIV